MKDARADNTLNETNYREVAKKMIETYEKKLMIIDALLWGQVIGFYEAALKRKGTQ